MCNRGLGFEGHEHHGNHGILVVPWGLIYYSDEIAKEHMGQIEENIGKYRASSKYREL